MKSIPRLAACVLTAVLPCLGSASLEAEPAPGLWLGTLQSEVKNVERARAAGTQLVCVEVCWSQYEPREGATDEHYVAAVKAKLSAFRQAGMGIVLDLGVQYPPAWVREAPDARYVNQYGAAYVGHEPGSNGTNAVFSAAARQRQARYVKQLAKDLGTQWVAVRLGGGFYGELCYPLHKYQGQTNCYWAFDELAQGKKEGLAKGLEKCPVPGWKPGEPSPAHENAAKFAEWYLQCLQNYHDWQITTARDAGFAGKLAMLYPSWGIRPGQLAAAVTADLGGTTPAEKNGEVQRGYDFARFVAGIHDQNVIVYSTWLDSDPKFGDDQAKDQTAWSPAHYLAELAHQHQPPLEAWGENTGNGDVAAIKLCFQRARKFELHGLFWAFEKDLLESPAKTQCFREETLNAGK